MTITDPGRPPGDLGTANRQDSIDAAVMVGPSISRITKFIFFAPSKCPIDLFGLVQQQLGSESREGCAYIRVDAPQQVLALGRVLVRAKMPDAVRGARVDD